MFDLGLVRTGLLITTATLLTNFFMGSTGSSPQVNVSHAATIATDQDCSFDAFFQAHQTEVMWASVALLIAIVLLVFVAGCVLVCCVTKCCKPKAHQPIDLTTALQLMSTIETLCTNALQGPGAIDATGIQNVILMLHLCKTSLGQKPKTD